MDSYGKPEIFNSDQGSQFTSSEFVAELRAHGILISMDGRGRCLDNAKMERFWWALKYEDIKIKEYVSLPQLRFGIMHYVHLYNSRRIHLAFQYRTPDEVCFGTCNRNAMGYSKPRAFTPIFIITVVPFRGKVHFNCNCSVRWHRLAEIMGYLGWYIV